MSIALEDIEGRVLDLDSHEQIATARWMEVFGERARPWIESCAIVGQTQAGPLDAPLPDDSIAITPDNVWEMKGNGAPGVADMTRRTEVLDVMGIRRALLIPGMGEVALITALGGLGTSRQPFSSAEDTDVAWEAVAAYNEWAADIARRYSDRLCVVGIVRSGMREATPETILGETEQLIASGIGSILVPVGKPMAGLSPADPALDPFYEALAEANVSLISHPPGAMGFVTQEWSLVADFGAAHYAPESFLSLMVLGGVFERHPTLRFGAIESGGWWIGPLARYLDSRVLQLEDMMAMGAPGRTSAPQLPMKPSEYIARNVRASVLLNEPVEEWLEMYPQVQDVYCYSSDYPHLEGKVWSLHNFYERIAPLGDDLIEKFFCTNAQLLLG